MDNNPALTIVTVVKDAERGIEKTIQSVLCQDYDDIEYIVIDGGSTDSTLDIVNKYKERITKIICGADNGIYDAMNKGTIEAKGKFITYLNAGDTYCQENVLSRIFNTDHVFEYDLVYGDNNYIKQTDVIFQKARPLNLFYKGMPFNHQSSFVKTDLAIQHPFKYEMYVIHCEYEFLLSQYLSHRTFLYIPVTVANYEAGGFSDMRYLERTVERWLINMRINKRDIVIDRHYAGLINTHLGISNASKYARNIIDRIISKTMRILN